MMERIFNLMFLAFGFCSCGVFAKSRFSAKCADRIMDIEIESIQRAARGQKQIWSTPDTNEVIEKIGCDLGTTWDLFFCVKVCELPIGSPCVPPSSATAETFDRCADDSECVSTSSNPFNPVFTCQAIASGFDDYFSDDSSSFFDFFMSSPKK